MRRPTNFSEGGPMKNIIGKPLINLLRGWPNPALLPTRLIENAAHNVLQNKSLAHPGMLYGPDPGDPRLRKNIAAWLAKFYRPRDVISPDRICITGGASQSLACLLQVFTDPVYTRNVWIVAPAYMLAFRIFEDSGFHGKLRAVPEDHEGIDIDFLRRVIRESEEKATKDGNTEPRFKPPRPWAKTYRHIIYAVPTFSNPSFKTMSLRRREALVHVAREFDALIITDDVYDFLQWHASPIAETWPLDKAILPRIVDIDRYIDGGSERDGADGFGNAVSNGSFSKICGPGLRTGWVEGTEKLAYGVSQTGSSRSGGAPSQLTATFVAETLESGELQRLVYETLQPAYCARYRRMISAINEELVPLGVQLPQMDRQIVGGYFIWLTLPSPLKGAQVVQRAKDEEALILAQGEIFEVPGDTKHACFDNALRICFAWEDEDKLDEGIRRLAAVIRTMQHESKKPDPPMQPDEGAGDGAKNFW